MFGVSACRLASQLIIADYSVITQFIAPLSPSSAVVSSVDPATGLITLNVVTARDGFESVRGIATILESGCWEWTVRVCCSRRKVLNWGLVHPFRSEFGLSMDDDGFSPLRSDASNTAPVPELWESFETTPMWVPPYPSSHNNVASQNETTVLGVHCNITSNHVTFTANGRILAACKPDNYSIAECVPEFTMRPKFVDDCVIIDFNERPPPPMYFY